MSKSKSHGSSAEGLSLWPKLVEDGKTWLEGLHPMELDSYAFIFLLSSACSTRLQTGIIERDKRLLKLREDPSTGTSDYTDQILLRAARQSERENHINEAIKLYHLAGDHETVVACLARALGDYIGDADDGGGEGAVLSEDRKSVV